MNKTKKSVLVVAAHPDDEVLGCAGTILMHVRRKDKVCVLILGEGITSRNFAMNEGLRSKQLAVLRRSVDQAANLLGVHSLFINNFPDNRFDTVPLLDIVKIVEQVKKQVKPDIIYTHHNGDLNIDHRITYEAVLTACRPVKKETVKEIYSFEVLSSTEWNYPYSFSPNLFVDITKGIDRKIRAMQCYKTEIRKFPHPRSIDALRANARHWGSVCGLNYAEAFETIRIIK